MAIDLNTNHEPSVTELVTGIIADAQSLFKQQVEMLTREIKEDFSKTREAAFMLGLGAGVGLVGAVLLALMLVLITSSTLPDLPLWACYGSWGTVLFIIGAGLAYMGKLKFDSFNPLKDETAQSVKENMAWITNPK
jgi:Kef-type K+ transport system membrane component KefB